MNARLNKGAAVVAVALLADVVASDPDALVFAGSRSRPRQKKGAHVPPDDTLELPETIELTADEAESMRGHQRKALTAARRAVAFIGADHSHNVRMHVETAQREVRAAFDVLDRAIKRARKAAQ